MLEAMAAVCPFITKAIDGNRELIDDGVHGWLVLADDPVAMARAVTAVLADPGEAQKRGEAAKNRVREQFSLSAMVDQWENIIRSARN